ncbi:MAG: iron-sulfur cluster assembly scaffold protein [bacterium]|nr:iron-sulfur cluster assembly scaffold protein [bacterium]
MDDLYHEELLEAARDPHHKGEMLDADVTSPPEVNSCGDSCRVFVRLTADKKHITAMKWQGTGCVISTASLSLLSDHLQGEQVAEVVTWDEHTLLSWLGLKTFSTARKKCLLLGLNTVQKVLEKV